MEHDTLVEGVMIPLQDCSHSQVNSVHDGILKHAREKEVRITVTSATEMGQAPFVEVLRSSQGGQMHLSC